MIIYYKMWCSNCPKNCMHFMNLFRISVFSSTHETWIAVTTHLFNLMDLKIPWGSDQVWCVSSVIINDYYTADLTTFEEWPLEIREIRSVQEWLLRLCGAVWVAKGTFGRFQNFRVSPCNDSTVTIAQHVWVNKCKEMPFGISKTNIGYIW